jgi:hypothetical protein
MKSGSIFRSHIAVPQEHGSWVLLFTPLATGLFAGGSFTIGSLALVSAAVALFLMRQSLTMAVKVLSGRQGY